LSGIAYIFKKEGRPGLFSTVHVLAEFKCPVCGNILNIKSNEWRLKVINIGFEIRDTSNEICTKTCPKCRFESPYIINEKLIKPNQEFIRTCLECGSKWHISWSDVLKEGYENQKAAIKHFSMLTNPVLGFLSGNNIQEVGRCAQCGSRKVNYALPGVSILTSRAKGNTVNPIDVANSNALAAVKNGIIKGQPNKTIEQVVNSSFQNPQWKEIVRNDHNYVNITGTTTYNGQQVSVLLQYEVNDDNSFAFQALQFNGVSQRASVYVSWFLQK
jgi:ssDNA-binding Zn-finger/Zn-ribbon topoisomerase 1